MYECIWTLYKAHYYLIPQQCKGSSQSAKSTNELHLHIPLLNSNKFLYICNSTHFFTHF